MTNFAPEGKLQVTYREGTRFAGLKPGERMWHVNDSVHHHTIVGCIVEVQCTSLTTTS